MEEDFDIETINFDEYNRHIYIEKTSAFFKKYNSQALDAQKRYKHDINRYVTEYKRGLSKTENDEENFRIIKKRKI